MHVTDSTVAPAAMYFNKLYYSYFHKETNCADVLKQLYVSKYNWIMGRATSK